ncbi:LOG family protein [Periweissella fabalis]|uniref:Cytokinin riboside 5'-monophosphate phosphoribohydrolase n=1 Tax=Periweissella fabalis TaxID=1070421 RepID=A0A7X6N2G7_9LACO|nr:TIGR00730 family Rossman fold protein [Periweissella fabalis]MCM0599848.1 TIGR00730 family Rossman fold protein [Periweissella fabalis]NKZ24097.1 TIGR00730 family Rossman fold protein [Periweissella fabalis]
MKRIAVYCGASFGNQAVYQQVTVELGRWMVDQNLGLVYGGGKYGLMGVLANQVLDLGGSVIGIVPQNLADMGTILERLEDVRIVPDISERKLEMLRLGDGCLALPGGPGTLEEIVDAFSWMRIGDNLKPCAFYNVNGYYDDLRAMFQKMVSHEFLTQTDFDKLLFSDSLNEIYQFMDTYVPPIVDIKG